MTEDDSYSLLLPFDTDESEFRRGFEIGRIWTLLEQSPDEEFTETLHTDNSEMLIRMGETLHREHTAEIVDDTWMFVTFQPANPPEDA